MGLLIIAVIPIQIVFGISLILGVLKDDRNYLSQNIGGYRL